jgi:hypothetical protein
MPDLSIYNGKWGPANKSVPGTSSELGRGLENTEKIAQIITE